jgi:uncharacterized membrane protein YphA (DoxX/SURF4 family)
MNWLTEHSTDLALLFARLLLGILFFIQGCDKLFGIGFRQVAEEFRMEYLNKSWIPEFSFPLLAGFSSFAEFTGGLLLITGLFIPLGLLLLSLNILIVVIGMGIKEPVWDMRYVFPRIVLLLLLWFTLAAPDTFSLDYLFELN